MHPRLTAVAVLTSLALGAVATSATAAPPEPPRGNAPQRILFDGQPEQDEFLSQVCGTPVTVTARGHILVRETLDANGMPTRIVQHPSFRQTISSAHGQVSTMDVGVDKLEFHPDGTLTIFGTGIHLKVKGGPKAIGLWRFVIDLETGEELSAEYHGRFDLLAPDLLPYLCSELAPPAP